MELPVPRTTAAAAAAAAIGPYAVRGIAGKEGTGISGALWIHGKLLEESLHFLLQNTGLTHTYWLSAPQGTLKDDNRKCIALNLSVFFCTANVQGNAQAMLCQAYIPEQPKAWCGRAEREVGNFRCILSLLSLQDAVNLKLQIQILAVNVENRNSSGTAAEA